METRFINLSSGDTLEISCTEEFYVKLRQKFGLAEGAKVPDGVIRDFFATQMRSAIEKAEGQ